MKATTLNRAQAEALWDSLGEALSNFETRLAEIIKAKAWEPLGYASFFEAWNARMSGYKLSSTIGKATAVYQMLDEGISDAEVCVAAGVGPDQFRQLARQKSNGVPPTHATTVVRQHYRKAPTEARTLHVTPSESDYVRFCEIARKLQMTNQELAEKAIQIVIDRGGVE